MGEHGNGRGSSETAVAPRDPLKALLLAPAFQDALRAVAPSFMEPDRLARVALIAANQNPQIRDCEPASIMQSMMQCAETGLEPGTAAQHAALVPYKTKDGRLICQFQPMYKGMVELLKRSGEVVDVETGLVYEGDYYKVVRGFNPQFDHIQWEYRSKTERPAAKGELVFAYALFWMAGVERPKLETISKEYLDKIKASSKAQSPMSPWNRWEEAMQRKTAIKSGCKTLRMSVEEKNTYIDPKTGARISRLARVIEIDNVVEAVVTNDQPLRPASALTSGKHAVGHRAEVPKTEEPKQEGQQPPVEGAGKGTGDGGDDPLTF